jgi:fermentation-respiration switch protein FrsA (DUF1100 family)
MRLLPVILLVAIAFYLLVKHIERNTVFLPSRTLTDTPQKVGLAFEDVFFTTADGLRINGWFIPAPGARWNLLYCHGNAHNLSDRVGKIKSFHELGFNVFIFDYRGYGVSEGRPTERGVYQDAEAAYRWLSSRPDVGRLPLVIYGASLGGAVAVDLATRHSPAALVLDSTFASAKDIAGYYYPFIPSFLVSVDMDSARKIRSIKAPKLIIHSRTDQMIPFAQAEKLFAASPGPKELLAVEGSHNDNFFYSEGKVREGLMKFLKGHGL